MCETHVLNSPYLRSNGFGLICRFCACISSPVSIRSRPGGHLAISNPPQLPTKRNATDQNIKRGLIGCRFCRVQLKWAEWSRLLRRKRLVFSSHVAHGGESFGKDRVDVGPVECPAFTAIPPLLSGLIAQDELMVATGGAHHGWMHTPLQLLPRGRRPFRRLCKGGRW